MKLLQEIMQKKFKKHLLKAKDNGQVDFVKYQVVKSKTKKNNMVKTKSPETRLQEKTAYMTQIEH